MKNKIGLSISLGTCFAVCAYVIMSFVDPRFAAWAACFCGVGTSVMLFEIFVYDDAVYRRKYVRIEQQIAEPFFLQVDGIFQLEHGIKCGRLYFCEEKVYVTSVECKPDYCEMLPFSDIDRYEFEDVKMDVYLKDGRRITMKTAGVAKTIAALGEKGLIKCPDQ